MKKEKTIKALFALVKAGLWENLPVHGEGLKVNDSSNVDWGDVYQLAEEQSIVGLVLAGIEHSYVKPPQDLLLQWIGEVQIIEQQNKAMNEFVASLIEILRKNDVYAILVKGQGMAQCYEQPLWRASGDVDLLLSEENYQRAKKVLIPLADEVEQEYKLFKHQGMTMDGGYVVELHGTLHSRLSKRVNNGIDDAQRDVLYGGNVRCWQNGNTRLFLPGVDSDVIFIFTHILQHFFVEGIGLRQICDWCRLLWTYRDTLNHDLLKSRIRKMRLMSEWKAFAALAVDWLGMPIEAMPMYSPERKWKKKAAKILSYILNVGNFGHNRDKSYKSQSVFFKRMMISLKYRTSDFANQVMVFPVDAVKVYWHIWGIGLKVVAKKMLSK